MDISHLADDELSFELKLRGIAKPDVLNRRAKSVKLKDFFKKENTTNNRPTSSANIIQDSDSCFTCQLKVKELLGDLSQALRKQDIERVIATRSRLFHYRFRLSLIADRTYANAVRKEQVKVQGALDTINSFLSNVSLLDIPNPEQQDLAQDVPKEPLLLDPKDQFAESQLEQNMSSASGSGNNAAALGNPDVQQPQQHQNQPQQILPPPNQQQNQPPEEQQQQQLNQEQPNQPHLNQQQQQHQQEHHQQNPHQPQHQVEEPQNVMDLAQPRHQQEEPDIREEMLRFMMRQQNQHQHQQQQQPQQQQQQQ